MTDKTLTLRQNIREIKEILDNTVGLTDLTHAQIQDVLQANAKVMEKNIQQGKKVVIKNVGTLEAVPLKARKYFNPRTKAVVNSKKTHTVKYKTAPSLHRYFRGEAK